MRIGLISGAYPPSLDGIGDYTSWMAQSLAGKPEVESPVKIFTSAFPQRTTTHGVEVLELFDPQRPASFGNLSEVQTIAELDWLVLQYNPFSYGRRGFCPWVPRTLARLRRRHRSPRIAVMFHETVVPRWPWKFLLMHCWQQPLLRAVCSNADEAFVSTERWTPQVRRVAPRLPVHHLPVGSNIPLSTIEPEEARRNLGIERDALVLGLFGGAHVSRHFDWIAATVEETTRRNADRRVVLLYVGSDGAKIHEICPHAELVDCGRLPGQEVGGHLRAMDAMISPFSDGISTRRGSAIAALQHGIPLATTRRTWTDQLFLKNTPTGLMLSTAESGAQFAHEAANWMERPTVGRGDSQSLTEFHDLHFTWSALASIMLGHLEPRGS